MTNIISMPTAARIWGAHREIETGKKLLADIEEALREGRDPVAALNEAGIQGLPYPEARKNVGTLLERNAAIEAALQRTTDSLDTFIRETEDPGTEALAAVYCARATLARNGAPS